MSRFRAVLTAGILCALTVPATAQGQDDHWRGQLEVGFNGASGNSSFAILRTGAKATHLRTDVAEFEASFLVRYGKNDEKVIANDQKGALKLDLWPQATWSPFLFVDAARDVIRKLDFRSTGGAGVKLALWSGEAGKGSLSGALLWDHQNFKVDPGSTSPNTENLARWSFRMKAEKTIGTSTSAEHVTFYQPAWNRSGDYLVTVANSVSTKVLENVSLSLQHEFLHDAEPPEGVKQDDQKFSVLLKMGF